MQVKIGNPTEMRHCFEFGIHLDATTSQVWHLITDTQTWPLWGPSIKEVDSPERFIRQGLKGRIRTPLGLWMPFAIGAVVPERYWDWQVCGVPATGHRLEPRDSNRCKLSFTVPAWAAFYGWVCRLALSRIARLLAQPLEETDS
jgi:hypothetical protein